MRIDSRRDEVLAAVLDAHSIEWAGSGRVGCHCSPDEARGLNAYRDHLFAALTTQEADQS